jgi:hypothetical protein
MNTRCQGERGGHERRILTEADRATRNLKHVYDGAGKTGSRGVNRGDGRGRDR